MESKWFILSAGHIQGPMDSASLRQLAAEGRIDESTEIAVDVIGPWYPASQVRGLFPARRDSGPRPSPFNSPAAGIPPTTSAGRANADTKDCPMCGETILAVAKKCKHCGEYLAGSPQKQGKSVFKASADFIGVLCSYHVMDCNNRVLAKLKPGQSFEVPIAKDTTMYVWYSCGFAGSVEVKCHANEVNRFSVSPSQLGMGCVVSRVDVIDSD